MALSQRPALWTTVVRMPICPPLPELGGQDSDAKCHRHVIHILLLLTPVTV